MCILEVEERNSDLISKLIAVWEASVRATHLFLSDSEILSIKEYVPQALKSVDKLIIAENDEEKPIAFMGIENKTLEMLFITPSERGQGLGKQLLQYGISNYKVNRLTVNEQNPQAKGFYEHMGFAVRGRSDVDEQGEPYPILYMKR